MNDTPSQPSMEPRYKKRRGIVLIVLFFYILIPYLIWTQTSWTRNTKLGATGGVLLLFVVVMSVSPDIENNGVQNDQQTEQTTNDQEDDGETDDRENSDIAVEEEPEIENTEEIDVVFDVPFLLEQDITYFAPVFGEPVNDNPTPTDFALETGAEERSQRFENEGYSISVRYDIATETVISISLSQGTNDMLLEDTRIDVEEADDLLQKGGIRNEAGYYYRFMWPALDDTKYTLVVVSKQSFVGSDGNELCNGYPECV